jgi:hypothetical protein
MNTERPLNRYLGDFSGAFADLGTFLSLVVAVLALREFDAGGILIGFGLFAIGTAAIYRLPIPVQPMKAIAAIVIVGALTPAQTMAAGLIIGLVLVLLAMFGIIRQIARAVPGSVILGIQLAVGIQLAYLGLGHVAADPAWGILALAVLVAGFLTPYRQLFGLLVIIGASVIAYLQNPLPAGLSGLSLHLPELAWPGWQDFEVAALTAVVPQLALTLSNAVLATAAIAADYFPRNSQRASATRLATGSGVLNLALSPLGALPMCHGSGGLVAQYGFGARTWRAPVIFGGACLLLGFGFGSGAQGWLMLIPLAAVGALLIVAGTEMAFSRRLFQIKPSCRLVVAGTAAACVATNMAAGLAIGLVLEVLRGLYLRHRNQHLDIH